MKRILIAMLMVAVPFGYAADEPDLPEGVKLIEHDASVFLPDPKYKKRKYDAKAQLEIYGGKRAVKTQRPLLELGRDMYSEGAYKPALKLFGELNPSNPQLLVYGDWRTAIAMNDNGMGEETQIATRLNLDIDFKLTATERLHAFITPFEKDNQFTRYILDSDNNKEEFEGEADGDLDTLFFEGDFGRVAEGLLGGYNQIDMPVAVGLMPFIMQNGIWAEDAFTGAAVTLPARNSRILDISNYDITLFTGWDRVSSPAFAGEDENDVQLYGASFWADANMGYWEMGYAYLEAENDALSYHNFAAAFTRRYFDRISNSIRVIGNSGQDGIDGEKTADGYLFLLENSLVTRLASTFVPYFNMFYGVDTPQSLMRAGGAGGILKNTGINFETDGLTGFPKLTDTAADSYGGAIGINNLFALDQQLVVEAAVVIKDDKNSEIGDEYGIGVRYQKPINNAMIMRVDGMVGFIDGGKKDDLAGARAEFRWKF